MTAITITTIDLSISHHTDCRPQPMWKLITRDGVDIEAYDGALKVGGISAREIISPRGLRLFVVKTVWVSPSHARRGLGTMLYRTAAALVPGILIRSARPSHLAMFTWAALARDRGAVFVESPYPPHPSCPEIICGLDTTRTSPLNPHLWPWPYHHPSPA